MSYATPRDTHVNIDAPSWLPHGDRQGASGTDYQREAEDTRLNMEVPLSTRERAIRLTRPFRAPGR